jgi:hypothetical protein
MRKIKKSEILESYGDEPEVNVDADTYEKVKDELQDDEVTINIVDDEDVNENNRTVITKNDLINLIKETKNEK